MECCIAPRVPASASRASNRSTQAASKMAQMSRIGAPSTRCNSVSSMAPVRVPSVRRAGRGASMQSSVTTARSQAAPRRELTASRRTHIAAVAAAEAPAASAGGSTATTVRAPFACCCYIVAYVLCRAVWPPVIRIAHMLTALPPQWYALIANAEFFCNDVQNEPLAEQLRERVRYVPLVLCGATNMMLCTGGFFQHSFHHN